MKTTKGEKITNSRSSVEGKKLEDEMEALAKSRTMRKGGFRDTNICCSSELRRGKNSEETLAMRLKQNKPLDNEFLQWIESRIIKRGDTRRAEGAKLRAARGGRNNGKTQ